MLGIFLEFVAAFVAAFLIIGVLLFVIRFMAPGPEHWNRKWSKYYTTKEQQEKIEKRDRANRWKKF